MASVRTIQRLKRRAGMEDRQYRVRILRMGGAKIGEDGAPEGTSQAIADDPFAATGAYGAGARRLILPPLGEGSLRMLTEHVDQSNILPQCIDAFQVNVDGFGHRWEPWVTQQAEDDTYKAALTTESQRLDEWLDYIWTGGTFIKLRKQMRYDREATGVGYFEAIRDFGSGALIGLNHIPSWTIRMTAPDPEWVESMEWRRLGGQWTQVPVMRRFRVYLQIVIAGSRFLKTWFKEFGDPRKLSRLTGEWLTEGTRSKYEATEILAFPRYHPVSPYGLPRWIGNLPSVLGSRAAEEINVMYFDNKTIPPLVVAVSGGQLTKASYRRLLEALDNLKGREHFHEALLLEAVPADQTGVPGRQRPQIELKPLTDRMVSDAMFANYDVANRAKVRGAARLPPIIVGETSDYNRATAEVSILMADGQVFQPERGEFDATMNRRVLPEQQPQYCRFTSLGPNTTMNEDLVQLLHKTELTGGMTPNIARAIMSDILETTLPQVEEAWGDMPFPLTLAQQQSMIDAATAPDQADAPAANADQAKLANLLAAKLSPRVKAALLGRIRAEVRAAKAAEAS